MHLERLRGRKIVDRVLRDGNVRRGRHMWLRWLPGPPRHPSIDRSKVAIYVGTLVSSKQEKSAVKRNRMRRRCREALRTILQEMDRPYVAKAGSALQLLILPRSSSLRASFSDLQNDLRSFLSTLPRSWPPQPPPSAPPSSSLR